LAKWTFFPGFDATQRALSATCISVSGTWARDVFERGLDCCVWEGDLVRAGDGSVDGLRSIGG
jgi:hypothetical protein